MHRKDKEKIKNKKSKIRRAFFNQVLRFLFAFFYLIFNFAGPAHADYQTIEVKKGGSLRGRVKFPTESPPRAMFANQGDPQCPRGIPQDHLIVNQRNRGIQNALIVLEIKRGKTLNPIQGVLESKECRFLPRLQIVTEHSNLQLASRDGARHVFHIYKDNAGVFAVDVASGTTTRRPLVTTGFFKINCDRHLWTRAWVYVTDQPYVTLTNSEGMFEITDIPAGTYTVRMWHEGWLEKGTEPTGQVRLIPMMDERRVTVRKEQVSEVLLDTPSPDILYPR